MIELAIFITLILVGYFAGTVFEVKHYRSIEARERKFSSLPAVTIKNIPYSKDEIEKVQLVYGSVVISLDYFKRFLGAIRSIFGGNIASYETLLDRGRREAILRMKEMGKDASIILNLRIETSNIGDVGSRRRTIGAVEVLAYGTAITLKNGLNK